MRKLEDIWQSKTEEFWQQGTVKKAMDAGMQQIEENLEQQYRQMFAGVFRNDTGKSPEEDRKHRLLELCSEWEELKRL